MAATGQETSGPGVGKAGLAIAAIGAGNEIQDAIDRRKYLRNDIEQQLNTQTFG